MDTNPEILIVGAGPTGLMMACQLLRFGVSFRIIDKQPDRAQESRAFGIQARTMELFQTLDLSEEFLKRCQIGRDLQIYAHGKPSFNFHFDHISRDDTPFPAVYFIPQSETEEILLTHLQKNNISIERQTELISFAEEKTINTFYEAHLKKMDGQLETIYCQYIVGCDGAHSIVRKILNIPFVGAAYDQNFILADISIEWPFPKNKICLFLDKKGIFGFIPLSVEKDLYRLIIADMENNKEKDSHEKMENQGDKQKQDQSQSQSRKEKNITIHQEKKVPSVKKLEQYAKLITHHSDIKIYNPVWVSEFHLHHRSVKQYQKGNAFLAGDAAHIHSPVGGQGMNTGLQDVTNLAWKLALVLKYQSPKALLKTYQTERQPVGQVLVKTTDRIFGFMIQKNWFFVFVRLYVMPLFMKFLSKSNRFQRYIFAFISELGIYYKTNHYVREDAKLSKDIRGLKAGMRAPDAPIGDTTLFDLLKEKPFNILIFSDSRTKIMEDKLIEFQNKYPQLIKLHWFMQNNKKNVADSTKDSTLDTLFHRYSKGNNALYLIRPDGYIGYLSLDNNMINVPGLCKYLEDLFGPK